jgi:hypothetical protein
LVAALLTIVRAAAESLVPAGQVADATRRRRANMVMAISAPLIALALFGGAKWWNAVDHDYQRTMFRAPAAADFCRLDAPNTSARGPRHPFRAIFAQSCPITGR